MYNRQYAEVIINAMIVKILMLAYASGALEMPQLYMKETMLSLKLITIEAYGYCFGIKHHSFYIISVITIHTTQASTGYSCCFF